VYKERLSLEQAELKRKQALDAAVAEKVEALKAAGVPDTILTQTRVRR
jgi:hypothetical protein